MSTGVCNYEAMHIWGVTIGVVDRILINFNRTGGLTAGYICLLMGGLWMSRLLKHNLMEDVFNNENESFMQETKLMENEYSVNLPTRFYYKMLDLFPTTSPSA